MAEKTLHIDEISIEEEMKTSYLDYSMSVIVGRALPDARDGLKPVHRRTLYSMYELKNEWNKSFKKSARIVGDVIGKYHPHGDTAVYDTIVRLAQDFAMRYILVDGQGNFGSIDGDRAAAMRYTEIRMSKISSELLKDLDKETVPMLPNYDGSEQMPSVLPTRVPNLLINGASGIAVGMATNIPPHNITEVLQGSLAYLDNPDITIAELTEIITGPDFPTGAYILGRAGIIAAYESGHGSVTMRAKCQVVANESSNNQIIITQLPYQVNKARLIEKIAGLCKDGKITEISNIRDESDKDGMSIAIDIKRGEVGEVLLNKLYKNSDLQKNFSINMVALVDDRPQVLNLKQLLEAFLDHRRDIVTKRSIFLLRKARERAHILEGLSVAILNIDKIIEVIRSSSVASVAKQRLLAEEWDTSTMQELLGRTDIELPEFANQQSYKLTEIQAQAILDLRLYRLTGLEYEKLCREYIAKLEEITQYMEILNSSAKLHLCIREELEAVLENFGDARRTEISDAAIELDDESVVTPEDRVITISNQGYIKAQSLADYRAQKRGGVGKTATTTKDEDGVESLVIGNTHDTILCFSDKGKVYWKKVYQFPIASRQSRGKPMPNFLPLDEGEKITTFMPVTEFSDDKFVVLTTSSGTTKKMQLSKFAKKRPSGLIACKLQDNDYLVGAVLVDNTSDIMLFSDNGRAVRFRSDVLRDLGRTAMGVRGIRMAAGEKLISMIIPQQDGQVLTISENGYGKRTVNAEYITKGRGGKGIISMKQSQRNGKVVAAVQVFAGDEVMCITNRGTLVRTTVNEIASTSRNTQGVRILKLKEDEKLITISRVIKTIDILELEDE